jgi:hypothetical protein
LGSSTATISVVLVAPAGVDHSILDNLWIRAWIRVVCNVIVSSVYSAFGIATMASEPTNIYIFLPMWIMRMPCFGLRINIILFVSSLY